MPGRSRVNPSYIVTFAVAAGLGGWLLSGALGEESAGAPAGVAPPSAPDVFTVEVRRQEAERVTRIIVNQGEALANREATVRAEVSGRVVALGARRGARVGEGELLVRLDVEDRQARLEEAQAALAETEQAYEAAERLAERGYEAETRLRGAFAELQAARAQLRRIELELEDTRVVAPFDGSLAERRVELGEYVAANEAVAEIIDLDPLIAVIQVSQQRIAEIERGMKARVELATGAVLEGQVSFIAPTADEETRTFRVEIEVPNRDSRHPAGVSAEVRIPVGTEPGHFISPALLSLGPDGVLGVKTVTAEGLVAFHEVDIVRSEANGIWVTGLPGTARLITSGQGYVRAGERVEVASEQQLAGRRARADEGSAVLR